MKNTSILRRIMELALSLALLVSMMPVLASEVYAGQASETVHIYKEDGSEATLDTDYSFDGDGVRYSLKSNNLRVTTNGYVVKAAFALDSSANSVYFKDCRFFVDEGYMIQGDATQHDQTINISGDCEFLSNNGSIAMLFNCGGEHEITFTSSDKENSLNIVNYGQLFDVNEGSLNFTGELNAKITGNSDTKLIDIEDNLLIKDNANLKIHNGFEHSSKASEGLTIGGGMYMAGKSGLDVYSNGTAIAVNGGPLHVSEDASLTASSYHYVVVRTNEEAEFDTTGRVELTNYHSDGLLCEKLKVLNKKGTILIRGTESTAIKMKTEGDITLGNKVKMYGSTNLNEAEKSITKEFVGITWKKEGDTYYHPYFIGNETDAPIKALLIKGETETPGGGGGSGGSTGGESINSGEIEKLKEALASADAKIDELNEQLQKLVKVFRNAETKVNKLKSVAKRKVTMRFNKIPGAQVYKIKYKQAGQKWKTVTTKRVTKTFTKLKSGKRFYVKVCGLYKEDSTTINSRWSKIKSVRVK